MTTSPESKWTKGPWRIGKGADGLPIVHTNPDTFSPSGQGVAHICKRSMCQDHIANAHLIAAAPDLYEALKKAMPFIDDALDVVEVMSESVLTKECREVVKLARAAIAKAEGR